MTGMSMWGVVGLTFGEIFQGYFAWMKSVSMDSLELGVARDDFLVGACLSYWSSGPGDADIRSYSFR